MAGDPSRKLPAATKRAFDEGRVSVGAKEPAGITPPKALSREGKIVWKSILQRMPEGTFAVTDQGQMMIFCEAQAEFDEATQMIGQQGRVLTNDKGVPFPNPWVKIRNDAAKTIAQIGPTLFLTPVSREALQGITIEAKPVSKLGSLLNRG